jgi:hypothetical protein
MDERPIKTDEKGRFVKGTAPGPGRPKGKTLKEWVRDRLCEMNDEQRLIFLKDIPNDIKWKMAEGNPSSNDNLNATVKVYIAKEDDEIDEGADNNSEGQPQV